MNFDVGSHLGAVARTVSALERSGQPAHAVTISRSYAIRPGAGRIPTWYDVGA